jgi:hypothetical protein
VVLVLFSANQLVSAAAVFASACIDLDLVTFAAEQWNL